MAQVLEFADFVRFETIDWRNSLEAAPELAAALRFNDVRRAAELAGGLDKRTVHAAMAHACSKGDPATFAALLDRTAPDLKILFANPYGHEASAKLDLAEMALEAFGRDIPGGFWDKVEPRDAAAFVQRAALAAKEGSDSHALLRFHPEAVLDLADRWETLAANAMTLSDPEGRTVFRSAMASENLDDEAKIRLALLISDKKAGPRAQGHLLDALADAEDGPLADFLLECVDLSAPDANGERPDAVALFQLDPGVFAKAMAKVDWDDPQPWSGLGTVLAMASMNSLGCNQRTNLRALALELRERAGPEGRIRFTRVGGEREGISLLTHILSDAGLFETARDRIDLADPLVQEEMRATGYAPYLEIAEAFRPAARPKIRPVRP